ncbi:S-adenosyl-L-methionine-dependent methyltransferase [Fomitiporia mediterranea MF3/22]|uniref:S-adenosyl-L-methionine-dependent methyltransferase n=1 Tax=Fomitiporia mediterranea (strain MF3/22) TaxID=694068 RepID=UPI000440757D|nr:S-adenosyl-L-methionine-dependent methyltransferase [Fomitiporia mediterranea MF3/22]EJD07225.1 S-adenosyl-L-methionine-dependent methyltransferase [Fomitiporia mediterranea MF3/22]
MVSSEISSEEKYVLPRNEVERIRLEEQHAWVTEAIGGRLIFDNSIQLKPGDRVLDSGVGAGSWTLALSKVVPDTVELVGVDPSLAMFPKDGYPSNIKVYEISTLELPAEWTNSFNLIHQRLLSSSFTIPMWQTAFSELHRVLKPGGAIQLMEIQQLGSVDESFEIPATKKVTEIAGAIMTHRELLGMEGRHRLRNLLEEAGFTGINEEFHRAPVGKQWGENGVLGAKIAEGFFRNVGSVLMAAGGLGICSSQDEVDEAIEKAKKEWADNAGIYTEIYVLTARKPV